MWRRLAALAVACTLAVAVSCSGGDDAADETSDTAEESAARGAGDVTGGWTEGEIEPAQRVLVPVQMYWLGRHFDQVDDTTATDEEIDAIFDASPEAEALLQAAYETYAGLPDQVKYDLFDPDVVTAAKDLTRPLDSTAISRRLAEITTAPDLAPTTAPNPPSGLTATNASRPSDPDKVVPAAYQVVLSWQDNASNESGFHVYRLDDPAAVDEDPQLVGSAGPGATGYLDVLAKPPSNDAQVCYQVTAYTTLTAPGSGQATDIDSGPSPRACSYYAISYPPLPPSPDSDLDGYLDDYDGCPAAPAEGPDTWPPGCPDGDGDGWIDVDVRTDLLPDANIFSSLEPRARDSCPQDWGEPRVPGDDLPPAGGWGCPYRYALTWMGMDVLNNSGVFSYDYKEPSLVDNEVGSPEDPTPGEDPYLLFAYTNGRVQGVWADGVASWCCGEVNVNAGDFHEPDDDDTGEADKPALPTLLARGLTVFPEPPNNPDDFAIIDRSLGLDLIVTLMERDYTAKVEKDQRDPTATSTMKGLVQYGAAVASTYGKCTGGNVTGCLAGIGDNIKTAIEAAFSLGNKEYITVDDPDDHIGTDVWFITADQARFATANDGVHPFAFEMPTDYEVTCLGVEPCLQNNPDAVPWTMRARMEFCLHRQGAVAAEQLRAACQPYEPVTPWPVPSTGLDLG